MRKGTTGKHICRKTQLYLKCAFPALSMACNRPQMRLCQLTQTENHQAGLSPYIFIFSFWIFYIL